MVTVATRYVKWSEQNQIEKDAKFQKFLEFEKVFWREKWKLLNQLQANRWDIKLVFKVFSYFFHSF